MPGRDLLPLHADAGAGLDWLAVFGFEETARYVDDDGVVHESEMRVGPTTISVVTAGGGEGLR